MCEHYPEFPAYPDITEMLVGRYGFAVKLCPEARPFARGAWYVLRPGCKHITGPFGTRDRALRLLAAPNSENEREWGEEAVTEWLAHPTPRKSHGEML